MSYYAYCHPSWSILSWWNDIFHFMYWIHQANFLLTSVFLSSALSFASSSSFSATTPNSPHSLGCSLPFPSNTALVSNFSACTTIYSYSLMIWHFWCLFYSFFPLPLCLSSSNSLPLFVCLSVCVWLKPLTRSHRPMVAAYMWIYKFWMLGISRRKCPHGTSGWGWCNSWQKPLAPVFSALDWLLGADDLQHPVSPPPSIRAWVNRPFQLIGQPSCPQLYIPGTPTQGLRWQNGSLLPSALSAMSSTLPGPAEIQCAQGSLAKSVQQHILLRR